MGPINLPFDWSRSPIDGIILTERVKSGTIITDPANALISTLHDRMPVILVDEDWAKWLGEEPATSDELKALLVAVQRRRADHVAGQQTEDRQCPQQGP
jgi:putative SOS response-associated peptidase YedK